MAENVFFTADKFNKDFSYQVNCAIDVWERLANSGLVDNSLIEIDFQFISNKKENLLQLSDYLKSAYGYEIEIVKKGLFKSELKGQTDKQIVTSKMFMFWVIDMMRIGYQFDSQLGDWGSLYDPNKQELLECTPEDDFMSKAIAEYEKGNLSKSLQYFYAMTVQNIRTDEGYYNMALLEYQLFMPKIALEDYTKAIELDENYYSAYLNRGALHDDLKDYNSALLDYEKAIELNPNESDAYFNMGNTFINMNNTEDALKMWRKASSLGEKDADERIKAYSN